AAAKRLEAHVHCVDDKVKERSAISAFATSPISSLFRERRLFQKLALSLLGRVLTRGPSMRSVVVTGASTGIGWGCVKVLIEGGFRVFGSVRKEADADRLSKEFGSSFTPLIFDVTDAAAVAAGANEVEAALGGETLLGLVNNAGIAVLGPLLNLK